MAYYGSTLSFSLHFASLIFYQSTVSFSCSCHMLILVCLFFLFFHLSSPVFIMPSPYIRWFGVLCVLAHSALFVTLFSFLLSKFYLSRKTEVTFLKFFHRYPVSPSSSHAVEFTVDYLFFGAVLKILSCL